MSQHTDLTVSLHDQFSDANVRTAAYHEDPAIQAEMAEAFPAYEPTAEELDAEYRAFRVRQLAATYERSVGGATRGRFTAYVRVSVRPTKVGTFATESQAWQAADAYAQRHAAAVVASGPQAA